MTTITWSYLDFKKHCKVLFGAYIEAHEDDNPTNTMADQTQTGICLGPATNFQGIYKILHLRKVKHIKRNQFNKLPMPQ